MGKTTKRAVSICITSAKGGVGKTTTTLNLAGIYEVLEKKVLIIDLDLTNGGIALSLNRPYKKDIYSLFDDISLNVHNEFASYTTKYDDYIDILPCFIDPRSASKISNSIIEEIIDRASFLYDVILIDTTHLLNELNLYTLDKVDKILYIIGNDAVNLKNMKSIIKIFNDLKINKYKILLNNSYNPYKEYFSLYDIKNIIKANIDYSISSAFFIPNIDSYVMNGKIITLDKRTPKTYVKDYEVLLNIATDLLVEEEENE